MKRTKKTKGKCLSHSLSWVTVPFPFCFSFCWDLSLQWGSFAAEGSHVYDKATLNWCDPILACLLQDSNERIETKRGVLGESRIRYFFFVCLFWSIPKPGFLKSLFCFSSLSLFWVRWNFVWFGCHEREGVTTLWWIWFGFFSQCDGGDRDWRAKFTVQKSEV